MSDRSCEIVRSCLIRFQFLIEYMDHAHLGELIGCNGSRKWRVPSCRAGHAACCVMQL